MPPLPFVTPNIERTTRLLARRQLGHTALLFLAGHRPLAFAGGQFLYMLTPLAMLIGFNSCREWAQLLSADEGIDQLEVALSANEPVIETVDATTKSRDLV